jgi:hypothetical protein
MSFRLFYSLTAFSLIFHRFLSAELDVKNEEFFEEVIVEDSVTLTEEKKVKDSEAESNESNHQIAFPEKNSSVMSEQKTSSSENFEKAFPKKLKPHYAGARRIPEKVKNNENEKKNTSRIKNKWFSSKTHPKVEKKEVVEVKNETPAELPADRPYYKKTNNSVRFPKIAQSDLSSDSSIEIRQPVLPQTQTGQEPEVCYYPRGGFQAPRGHFFFTAEWLYWRTRQEGMEFATAKKVDFDFQSGFRVGLGVHLPHDRWDIYVNYTRFNPEGSESASGSLYPLFLFEGAGAQGPSVAEAHAHWKIEFQNLDVEIGRAVYIAKTLVLRPFFGLKGAWIDQDAHLRYEGGFIPSEQTFRTHFENDFKGAGPLIGVESNWLIGAGFSFFGDFAAALIIGHFDNEQKQHQLGGVQVVDLNSDFNLVSPTMQIIAGLAWDRNFNKERWHVGLSAGFESQYWWSQNQTEQFTDKDFPIYVREKGDLAFYGLTLRARFDF